MGILGQRPVNGFGQCCGLCQVVGCDVADCGVVLTLILIKFDVDRDVDSCNYIMYIAFLWLRAVMLRWLQTVMLCRCAI